MVPAEVGELGLRRMAGAAVQCVDQRSGAAAGVREPLGGAGAEVEQHLHPVAVVHGEVALLLLRADVGLAEEDGIAAAPLEELDQRAQVGDRLVRGVGADRLDHERQRVDPEPGDAEFQPEAEDLVHLVQHVRVGDVQVGHEVVVPVHVPLAGGIVVGPRARLLAGERHLAGFGLLGVAPAVVVPVAGVNSHRPPGPPRSSLEALMSANWCPVYQTPVLYSRFPRTFSAAYRRCKNGYAPRYTTAPSLPWRPSHHQPLANRHGDR